MGKSSVAVIVFLSTVRSNSRASRGVCDDHHRHGGKRGHTAPPTSIITYSHVGNVGAVAYAAIGAAYSGRVALVVVGRQFVLALLFVVPFQSAAAEAFDPAPDGE